MLLERRIDLKWSAAPWREPRGRPLGDALGRRHEGDEDLWQYPAVVISSVQKLLVFTIFDVFLVFIIFVFSVFFIQKNKSYSALVRTSGISVQKRFR